MVSMSINWMAVAACVIVSMISGFIWYNPKTFFPAWWKGIGKSESDVPGQSKSMGITYALTMLASFTQAVFMSFMITIVAGKTPESITAISGITVGLILWVGFIAPTYLVNKLFAGHGFKVWAIEAGNHLLNFLLFGAIIGVWR